MVSRQEARQQLRELEGRRKTIEDEMEALTQTLSAGAGVRGSLVDSEGFPRADVDVHQTLIHRNRMACAPPAPSLPPPHARTNPTHPSGPPQACRRTTSSSCSRSRSCCPSR